MNSCFGQFGHWLDRFMKRFRSGIDQKWNPVFFWSLSEVSLSNNITHTNRFRVISIKSDTVLENYQVTDAFYVVENYKNRDFPEPSWLHNQRFIFVGTFTNTQISDFSKKATRLVLTSLTILNWFSFFTQNCGFALRQNGSDIFFTKEKCF